MKKNFIENFKTFNDKSENKQEVTVILTEEQDYKDIIQKSNLYGASYIQNSYQKQNHLISITFIIDYELISLFVSYLNSVGVEDIITD